MLQRKSIRWLSAAVVAFVVLGGLSLLSRPPGPGADGNEWWLGPSSAWAAQINAALSQATVRGVTCRERILTVESNGSSSESSTWNRFYVSENSYRRDVYDGNRLREVQWYIPEAGGMLQTGYRLDKGTYGALHHKGNFGVEDPVQRIRFYVELLEKADRLLGEQTIDGHTCVGFEIGADKYGSNPSTWIDRIWFDTATRLPVRIERAGRPVTGTTSATFTIIQDQFNYNPVLPPDTFTPTIPDGLEFSNSPDSLPDKW